MPALIILNPDILIMVNIDTLIKQARDFRELQEKHKQLKLENERLSTQLQQMNSELVMFADKKVTVKNSDSNEKNLVNKKGYPHVRFKTE